MGIKKEVKHTNWTKEEDDKLKKVILKNTKDGVSLKKTFQELSSLLNRTEGSIAFRWSNKIKKEIIGEFKDAKKLNKPGQEKKYKNDKDFDVKKGSVTAKDILAFIKEKESLENVNKDLKQELIQVQLELERISFRIKEVV